MYKKDLLTGDVVVTRGGHLGVIIKNELDECIFYQHIGSDPLDDFNDDLTIDDETYPEGDIMRVYRGNTFLDVENGECYPIYQRDFSWCRTVKENVKTNENNTGEKEMNKKSNVQDLKVLALGYYGNRNLVDCTENQIDEVLTGASDEVRKMLNIVSNRKFVALPNTECYVLYDANREVKEHSRVVCFVSEQDIKIYDKCIFCRKDGDKVRALLPEDIEKISKYIVD